MAQPRLLDRPRGCTFPARRSRHARWPASSCWPRCSSSGSLGSRARSRSPNSRSLSGDEKRYVEVATAWAAGGNRRSSIRYGLPAIRPAVALIRAVAARWGGSSACRCSPCSPRRCVGGLARQAGDAPDRLARRGAPRCRSRRSPGSRGSSGPRRYISHCSSRRCCSRPVWQRSRRTVPDCEPPGCCSSAWSWAWPSP